MVQQRTGTTRRKPVDMVLSGGGVKGVGLVGAVVAVMEAGYSLKRVSGVSAGSLVGSILAAGSNGDQLTTIDPAVREVPRYRPGRASAGRRPGVGPATRKRHV